MIRGTTPYHYFNMPFDITTVTCLYVTYMQGNDVILEKTLDDVTLDIVNNRFVVHLTQAETLLFECSCLNRTSTYVQLRGISNDEAWASKKIRTIIEGVLKEGEIPAAEEVPDDASGV